ncbi:Glucoside xylosyltransferase 2 [Chionoecetes opilio]|uniref:UDP-D-xylose:beta-D-glucoside alpha-1,3-D-xylosyltransferase n=1 Tax=Chionoecetes opilio TaxID=41210 RepID=A0A8J5BZA3_CHIOP|nr:Glucoside xylosyltransferase 2 [Chionoecetes opilio]
MKMKCTYRVLVVVAAACCVVLLGLLLGVTQDVTGLLLTLRPCNSPSLLSASLNATPLRPAASAGTGKDGGGAMVRAWGRRGSGGVGQAGPRLPLQISRLVVGVVCCGDRLNETRTMLKSAAALSHTPLTLIVFTEEALKPAFRDMHASWSQETRARISLDLHPITFPAGQDAAAWRKLFKPCASQRLFMPSLLHEVDALIYVDTDVLFMAPLEHLWGHFSHMNASHMAAMAPEHEDLATGWYNRFAKHPYYGRLGVNSGVMLMNLTRLRRFGWEEYVVPIYKYYKLAITWGDQDIINIIFHFHPDKLYVYGCEYNLRPDHCMYMSVCKTAETRGIFVLHGNRGTFHSNKQPAFRAVYLAWAQYRLGQDLRQDLYYPMQRLLLKASNTTCGKIHNAFLKGLSSVDWMISKQIGGDTVDQQCGWMISRQIGGDTVDQQCGWMISRQIGGDTVD